MIRGCNPVHSRLRVDIGLLALVLVHVLRDLLAHHQTTRARPSLTVAVLGELGDQVRHIVLGEDGRVGRGLLVLAPVFDERALLRAGSLVHCMQLVWRAGDGGLGCSGKTLSGAEEDGGEAGVVVSHVRRGYRLPDGEFGFGLCGRQQRVESWIG